ncbi:eukaryotic translation initiation factor 3 subunit L-like [Zophobas morio]|uniref:eukaryotic translation initiation factor 3 subunit L-like n=1 Tax=Zophobas morio TaxID=2755281 RepID=UPI0030827627
MSSRNLIASIPVVTRLYCPKGLAMDLIKNSDTDDPSTNSNYELLNSAYVWQNGNVTNVEEDLEKGGSGYKSEEFSDQSTMNFLFFFYDAFKAEGDEQINLFLQIYEEYNELSQTYFKQSRWPAPEVVSHYFSNQDSHHLFLVLYKELYYRHIHTSFEPTFQERLSSFENYCNFFHCILSSKEAIKLELPHAWLWDIIDEFLYQFRSFSRRSKELNLDQDGTTCTSLSPQQWNVHIVLNVLHSLVEKSNINAQLQAYREGQDHQHVEAVAGGCGSLMLYKMLGYFSLIGLCRVHCLLGDYHQALNLLENVEINRKISAINSLLVLSLQLSS